MLPENLREALGLGNPGLKDYELVKKIKEAREKKLEEVELVLGNGEIIKIRLKQLDTTGIMGHEVDGW